MAQLGFDTEEPVIQVLGPGRPGRCIMMPAAGYYVTLAAASLSGPVLVH